MVACTDFVHTSVMPDLIHEYQNLAPGKICVDATLGGAGHALDTVKSILPEGILIGIDRDKDALAHSEKVLAPYKENVRLFHSGFCNIAHILHEAGIDKVDSVVLDLGFSLNQIQNSGRGFSFSRNEPLDMRMNTDDDLTAEEIVNTWSAKDLAKIFFEFGEERFSRRVAAAIVSHRERKLITRSLELAGIVSDAIPAASRKTTKIHPATRVFQALRIAVNRELEQIHSFMEQVVDILADNARLCVISFHSLEDRIVKQGIRKYEFGCTCPRTLPFCTCGFEKKLVSVNRKPLLAGKEELQSNPMARSAKLRVAQKTQGEI